MPDLDSLAWTVLVKTPTYRRWHGPFTTLTQAVMFANEVKAGNSEARTKLRLLCPPSPTWNVPLTYRECQ